MSSKRQQGRPRRSSALIQPSQIKTVADAKLYFRQRLGSDFRMLPCIKLSFKAYHELIEDSEGLLKRSGIQTSEYADEILIAPPDKNRNTAFISFAIENPKKLLPILAKLNPCSSIEKTFVESLIRTHKACIQLHERWKN